ncbi:MAG TPA: protein kinase [Thermoanaerobaculia bacterium]|nr:protein kinase [Thermoanaerobaculia bacterium]
MTEVPQSFDRFEVLRVLGKGGMGTVYLARDPRLDRPVALKVLHAEDVATDERRARFLREARTAAAIRHPNVATIYEVGESAGLPFIVMEYCEGETLSQRLRNTRLETPQFLNIAKQIAAGVAAAHEHGIVHRDLKSANIIIEPSGQVKILDFGLAKALHRDVPVTVETTTGSFFGTIHYLSPEQARGQPADERSDLFSLGVVFYQMATGQLPFDAEVPLMVLEKIRDHEPAPFVPLDPTFPPAAAKIIGKLLQKNPANRYQRARDVVNDLEELATTTARHSLSHSRSIIGRTKKGPNWVRVAVIAACAAIVIIAIRFAQSNANDAASPTATAAPAAPLPPIRSLAVLPLSNIGTSTSDEFLSVGVADALTTNLQQIPTLQVRPTSAVLAYRNQKNVDAKRAGKQLHVDGLLEGHFLAAGDLVRVNLQLTDARTGYSVWADTIDGRRHNLLHLIDEVSARTVSALNQKLGVQQASRGSEPRSKNPKAYEEFLKARSIAGSLVPAEHRAQIAALKRAIALDPNFAAAYADLAIALSLGQARALDTEPDIAQKTEWYARQAVRLDPNLAASHLALARAFVRFPDRYRESVREDLAALRLNPNDTHALNSMTTYFVSIGEMQKAQCVGDRLVRIDPNSNDAKSRGYWYVNSVDGEGALQNAQWALQSPDTELLGHDIRAVAYILLGNLPAATAEANRVSALNPNHYLGKSLKAEIAAATGDKAACIDALKSFEGDAERNHWAAMRQAFCYAKIGDGQSSVAWVDKAAALGDHGWYAWVKHPWMQPVQADPEFQKTIGKMKADLDDVHDDVIGVYQLICK